MKNDPALLARRMSGGPFAEKEPAQRIIMSVTSIGFIALLVLPAIDHRLHWSELSLYAVLTGDALVLIGWLGIFLVFRENSFSSATIELAADQRVISTGPYAWGEASHVCDGPLHAGWHPHCAGFVVGVLVIVAMLPVLIWRLTDEERFLVRNLPGYADYQNKVPYRLLPLIW